MPQGFSIGPLTIRFYALIILSGALLAAWLSSVEAERRGRDKEMIWDILPWVLIGGILGARLWHVFTPSASNAAMGLTTQYYLSHPLQILMIWRGGLGIPGGVIGGALALYIYTKIKKENFLQWADIIAPGLLLAQAIGRWGNFVNQELYGGPSDLPWAITIDPQFRLPGFENVARYHPMFLYESLLNLLAAGILLLVGRKYKDKLFKGDLFWLYLVLYPAIRFGLEFLRLDPSEVGGFNINQSIMALVAVVAGLGLLYRHFVHPPKAESLANGFADDDFIEEGEAVGLELEEDLAEQTLAEGLEAGDEALDDFSTEVPIAGEMLDGEIPFPED